MGVGFGFASDFSGLSNLLEDSWSGFLAVDEAWSPLDYQLSPGLSAAILVAGLTCVGPLISSVDLPDDQLATFVDDVLPTRGNYLTVLPPFELWVRSALRFAEDGDVSALSGVGLLFQRVLGEGRRKS